MKILQRRKAERAAREAARAEQDLGADIESAFDVDTWLAVIDDLKTMSADGRTLPTDASQMLHDEFDRMFPGFCPEKGHDHG